MSEELKPCPFCSSYAMLIPPGDPATKCNGWAVVCSDFCLFSTNKAERWATKERAIEVWNTRPIEDALRQQLSTAQKELEEREALIANLTLTGDGVPIVLGDCLYFRDPDDPEDHVLLERVVSICEGVTFPEYAGTHTVMLGDFEMGNLEVFGAAICVLRAAQAHSEISEEEHSNDL